MKPAGSALGRYSAIVAAIVCVGTIASAILARVLGHPDPFLDMLAFGSFTAVLGTAGALAQLNGTVKRTQEQDDELTALRRLVATMQPAQPPQAPPDGR